MSLAPRRPRVGHENAPHAGRERGLDADRSVLEDEDVCGFQGRRVEPRGGELEDLRMRLALAAFRAFLKKEEEAEEEREWVGVGGRAKRGEQGRKKMKEEASAYLQKAMSTVPPSPAACDVAARP